MHFRAIDEQPLAAPRPGVSRLLLGFAALSLLLHGLLLIGNDNAAPLTIQPLGSPYIRAVLSAEATPDSNDDPPANSDDANKPPHAAQPREVRQDSPAPARTKTPEQQKGLPRQPETVTPPRVETEAHASLTKADGRAAAPPETAATPADAGHVGEPRQAPPAGEGPTGKNPPNTSQTGATAQRNYLLGQLRDQLSRHLTYPLRARRRGWEGEVLLGLRLDREGQLHDIQLLRSSGHALLDRSALKALARIERLRLPAGAPALQPIDLQLPVIYRLGEG